MLTFAAILQMLLARVGWLLLSGQTSPTSSGVTENSREGGSDVVFPEKYFLGNFPENFWKFSGNFPKKMKIFLII